MTRISTNFQKGFGFLHKLSENVSTMLPTVFQWRTSTSACRDRPMNCIIVLSELCFSTVCRSVIPCMLTSSQPNSLAKPNRSWISTQNGEIRLFGDIHIRTGMSVKPTQPIHQWRGLKSSRSRSILRGIWPIVDVSGCGYSSLEWGLQFV